MPAKQEVKWCPAQEHLDELYKLILHLKLSHVFTASHRARIETVLNTSCEDQLKISAFNTMLMSDIPSVKAVAERFLKGAENLEEFVTFLRTYNPKKGDSTR